MLLTTGGILDYYIW